MAMHDLDEMLASLDVEVRDGVWVFVTFPPGAEIPAAIRAASAASIHEMEGPTHVVPEPVALAAGLSVEFRAAWLTLTVHSALEAVGLTAAFATALAEAAIPCNVLAGFHHDHLLVPVERVDEAVAVLRSLGGAGT